MEMAAEVEAMAARRAAEVGAMAARIGSEAASVAAVEGSREQAREQALEDGAPYPEA